MYLLGLTREKVSRECSRNRVWLSAPCNDTTNKSLGSSMPLEVDSSLRAGHVKLRPAFGSGLTLLLGNDEVVALQLLVIYDHVSQGLCSG